MSTMPTQNSSEVSVGERKMVHERSMSAVNPMNDFKDLVRSQKACDSGLLVKMELYASGYHPLLGLFPQR
jgi:hypothetical protein